MIHIKKDEIEEKIKQGLNYQEIANEFRCSRATICNKIKKYGLGTKLKDLVGQKFGMLTVVSKIGSKNWKSGSHKGTVWLCKCDCGSIKEYETSRLTSGRVKSCGCYFNSDKFIENHSKWNKCGDIYQSWWNTRERDAKKRGYEFNIDIKYGWDLFIKQNRKCALSGIEIQFSKTLSKKDRYDITASLDRINNDKGYIIDNVQWVDKRINFMKHTLKQEEFLELCNAVARTHNDQSV